MKTRRTGMTLALFGVLVVAAMGQTSTGPDVIVGSLPNVQGYGSLNGISAYSIATTSCNIGDQPLNWQANNSNHPVIAQHMYRYFAGRFEQIGQSFLKHGFTALTGNLCSTCNGPGGNILSPGCSDPYSSSLNGNQGNLGPKSEVNASTGGFPYPYGSPGLPTTVIYKRMQVHNADMSSVSYPGAQYFVEGHYIANDDTANGNDDNNASYRPVNVTANGSTYDVSTTGSTAQQQAAIFAWQVNQPSVMINSVDVPGDGRFLVGFDVTQLANGNWQWEFAVQNLNSYRSARQISVQIPTGASPTNVGFHDVDYHSGDGDTLGVSYDGTDWANVLSFDTLTFYTDIAAINPNANALRWGTLYNFRFQTQLPPQGVIPVTIGLYRPGTPTTVTTNFNLTGFSSIAVVSGDNQITMAGEDFPQPLVLQVTSTLTGAPLQGATIIFGTTGVASLPSGVAVSDSSGLVTVIPTALSYAAGLTETVTANGTNNSVSWTNLYVRGLSITSTPSALNMDIFDDPLGSPIVPYIVMAGTPYQPPVSTIVGNLYLNPQDLFNTIVFCDGVGLFNYITVQGQWCTGTPDLHNIYTIAPAGAATGQTIAFQALGVNPGLGGYGVWLSNTVMHTFN